MDSQFDLAVRSLLSDLEWLTIWLSFTRDISKILEIAFWHSLYRERGIIVYDQFFIRITDWELPLGKPIALDFLRSFGEFKETS
uniref:Uncharacterized protein n=1 Tax=Tetranychus urticae TaxID=32264 RepID=T1KE03_TETUR